MIAGIVAATGTSTTRGSSIVGRSGGGEPALGVVSYRCGSGGTKKLVGTDTGVGGARSDPEL